ncbi:uncharacterized protein [Macrobrachium rosenbergii]|uniref:uncharacterized protein isoform X2 n=1 Tax=Macrobrachium rosenbergii TaxID=79674 RepID=UPI0034D650FE
MTRDYTLHYENHPNSLSPNIQRTWRSRNKKQNRTEIKVVFIAPTPLSGDGDSDDDANQEWLTLRISSCLDGKDSAH